jgi:hypothetical protein
MEEFMDQKMYNSFYEFVENDEIDYPGIKEVATRFGKKIADEREFQGLKVLADNFLATKKIDDFEKFEKGIKG